MLGDKHSVYYNEQESEDLKDELNGYFYGMGAGVYQEKGKLVTVSQIYKNSPAEKAGLKGGDLIVKADGTRIKTFEELQEIKNSKEEGDSINIEFIRDGKTQNTTITLTSTSTTMN